MTQFNYSEDEHRLVSIFEGKLDTLVSLEIHPMVNDQIVKYLENKPGEKLKVCFDFTQVDFITSTFIRVCVASAKTVGKENFSITNTNPLIKKTLKIAGLDDQLNVS